MKKLFATLFAVLFVVAVYAQETVQKFDGSEFTTMTPTENAEAYTNFLRQAYTLNTDQASRIYDYRLATAKHIQLLDKEGRGTADYQEKRAKILEYGQAKVLNTFTKKQLIINLNGDKHGNLCK